MVWTTKMQQGMKKFIYIFAACAAVLSVSCSKASTDTGKEEEKPTLVHMILDLGKDQIQSDEQTKAYFVDDKWSEQWWKKDDAISVFSSGNYKMTNEAEDGHNAQFEGDVEESDFYTLLYPYDESASSPRTGILETSIPVVQTLGEGQTCDPNALLSACSISGDIKAARMQNYFSLVVIPIKGEDITSVTLEGNNGEVLAGKVDIDLAEETVTGADVSKGGATAVTLKPSGATFAEGEYGIAIAPTDFTKGFKIIYKHSGSKKSAIKSTSSDKYSVERNCGLRLPSFTLADADYKYYYLLSAADLEEWQQDASNWASTDVVYLGADIDYAEKEFSRKSSTAAFTGTFNGRYHRIYNIRLFGQNKRAGLFYQLNGTVKNLCIGSPDYDWETGEGNYDDMSASYITGAEAGSTTWYYAGGIAAYVMTGGKIENCVNFANVYADYASSTADQQIRIGGIAGTIKNNTTIKDCKNFGNVTMSVGQYVVGSSAVEAGGITSRFDGDGSTLTGCSNYGTVTNSCLGLRHLGGIIGAITYDNGTLTNNKNYGIVKNDAAINTDASGNYLFIGGVAGLISSTSATVNNLENHGAVTSTAELSIGLEIAGVVAETSSGIHDCTNAGPITIGASVGGKLYAGGVCAWNEGNQAIYSCENAEDGTITMAGGLTVGGTLYVGGVLASEKKGNTLTHYDFKNYADIAFGSGKSEDVRIATSNTEWSCIGGCVGGLDDGTNHNTYQNMENYGAVKYFGNHKVEMGGCVGFAAKLTGTLRNEGNLRYQKQPNGGNSYLGGIVGWLEEATSLENAVCIADIDSNDSAARARTAGIAGGVSKSVTVIRGCKYKGDLRGTTAGASAGLMCTVGDKTYAVCFENCVVGTGTRWYNDKSGKGAYGNVSALVLNYSNVTSSTTAMLCGSGTSDTNGATTGTMTNCTIGTVN